jgi:GNAT superfamily N-acetyltransferase
MVFDASVPAATRITVSTNARPTLRLNFTSNLSVEVVYDEITERQTGLPMTITLCDSPWNDAVSVSAVKERSIDPLGDDHIAALFVHPSAQNRGLGKELLVFAQGQTTIPVPECVLRKRVASSPTLGQ